MSRLLKTYKLILHQKSQQKHYAGEEIAFCTKDFPNIGENDVVEIYNPEEGFPRLLLKVTANSLLDDFSHKDALSIEKSIATTAFQLKAFSDVIVNKVDIATVELDSVELTFKDQYLGRSEMWRLKNSLVDTCIYLNKKIEFAAATIRCQVHEMWSHGDKVAAGVVTAATKIVFRSSTSMVYLFIQMSSEMWEFDIYGDLYFEKAVNGFLAELFAKWKKTGSNHDVTIVLFSRTYYEATSSEEFPESMRECLQTDYKGRFYEDYYRVAVQNGKYEDWGNTLIYLKHLFVEYQSYLFSVHAKENSDEQLPKSFISSAAQGNFLEVLNMSLNVFEKHYMDRSCDRTGQLSVVITPGVGVFEVDRELTNVTMQRIIDNGVGSDLVCVGEQPLHAVPLLKFHNKTTSRNNVEDYSMPHWINLSFYSTNKKVGYSSYIPRIKLPVSPLQNTLTLAKFWEWTDKSQCRIPKPKQNGLESAWPNSVYDYDEYDTKVFQLPKNQMFQRRSTQRKKASHSSEVSIHKIFKRQSSEPEIHQGNADFISLHNSSFNSGSDRTSLISPEPATSSPAITIPVRKIAALNHLYSSSFGALNIEDVAPNSIFEPVKSGMGTSNKEKYFYDDLWSQNNQKLLSPASTSQCGSPKDKDKGLTFSKLPKDTRLPSKALINPFDPSRCSVKLTPNRRRWTHIFPRGPTGALIQQHHFHSNHAKLEIVHEGQDSASDVGSPSRFQIDGSIRSGRSSTTKQASDGNLALMWGATGEQEWTPALQTGVDWKSLTIPACLPITTDYFPDERSLQIDYVVSDYSLLPDDVNADYAQQRVVYRRPLTTREVFFELVSQRLAQGFQLIVQPKGEKPDKGLTKPVNPPLIRSNTFVQGSNTDSEEYFLSIGRVFHKITLDGSTIIVTRYRPRHAYPSIKIHYRYRFHAPNNCNYEVSSAEFSTEKLENYNWNYVDHYICTRGDRDFGFVETLKYWRFRMYLLPNFQSGTKRILEGAERTNIYSPLAEDDKSYLADGFLKFIEMCINRVRRPTTSPKKPMRGLISTPVHAGFRERVGTGNNRLNERPRSRSGSKVVNDRWGGSGKSEASGRLSPGDTSNSFFEGKSLLEQSGSLPDFSQDFTTPVLSLEGSEEPPQSFAKLSFNTPLRSIIDTMQSTTMGFPFIKCEDLPNQTFVSADAVSWLLSHMEGIEAEKDAVHKFNEMIEEQLISHASGNAFQHFVNGFFLYCITTTNQDGTHGEKKRDDLAMFQNDWMEVELNYERFKIEGSPTTRTHEFSFRSPEVPVLYSNQQFTRERGNPLYKDVYLDIDVGKKSDRQEWGHVRYQSSYKPDEAFEMISQWIQATGSIVTELVQGWSRKAQQCNMQLVPIPSDPFALPCSSKSDSLRGPIFVPLNVESIMESRSHLFGEFPEQTWGERMFLLQESIVLQFGFMRSLNPSECDPNHHYVHCSGNMFVFIPTSISPSQSIRINDSPSRFRRMHESPAVTATAGSHEDYITRHVSGKNKDSFREEKRVGFLWSWNYMLSKRWKTSSTPALGDEAFMMKILRDFQAFCDNQDNRLLQFWRNSDPSLSESKTT